jgi:hypothetical protein
VSIRDRLRRLERLSERDMVLVPQPDGPPAKFPKSAVQESFVVNMQRLRGEDVEPHPLGVAAARSPAPEWHKSFYAASWVDVVRPIPDLSEGAEPNRA